MKFSAIIFDLDSTLVKIEGLDFLAELKGKGSEMREITEKAMNGEMQISEAFAKKMQAIRPSKKDFETLSEQYCNSITGGAGEVISLLQNLGKKVFIVTGSFEPGVEKLAEKLDIPMERVFANKVFFNQDGSFKDFDSKSPLAKNFGKAEIVKKIKSKTNGKIAFVGDGVTDLETRDVVDLFIGFGGVAERKIVKENAKFFAKTMEELPGLILDADELKPIRYGK